MRLLAWFVARPLRSAWQWARRAVGPARPPTPGEIGEALGEKCLIAKGYQILDRRHRNSGGELDLIALDAVTVVFVEVKARIVQPNESPAFAVDQRKQVRLTRAAMVYLKQKGWLNRRTRFDVVSIAWTGADDPHPRIDHFTNAFPPVDSLRRLRR